jgi:hypothetical protein
MPVQPGKELFTSTDEEELKSLRVISMPGKCIHSLPVQMHGHGIKKIMRTSNADEPSAAVSWVVRPSPLVQRGLQWS